MKQAKKQQVLIFCSVPDQGNFDESDILYPAATHRKDVILIGAADPYGTRYNRAHKRADFYLPGVDVPVEAKDQRRSRPFLATNTGGSRPTAESPVSAQPQNVTGSSVATALGAGLAALLIYSIKAGVLALWISNKGREAKGLTVLPEDVEKLNIRESMVAAFSNLGVNMDTNYIEVWKELEKLTKAMAKVHQPGWQRCTTKDKEEIRDKVIKFVDNKLKRRG